MKEIVSKANLGQYMDVGNIEANLINPQLPTSTIIPVNYIPTTSGNLLNLNEFVTDSAGDKWFIDYGGDAIRFNSRITEQVSGQFLFDPNEINGWGPIGYIDESNIQDLGDVGVANLNRLAGGFVYPFDVKIKRFYAWHNNSNAAALPWGWVISKQTKTSASNAVTTSFMLDESFDRGTGQFGLRNYGNNQNQLTDISSFVDDVITAGQIINLAVGAPTAVTTNNYVQIMGGYIEFERI